MKPTLDELIAFSTVYETGGLTKAARRLNLAKSVVSKRLADLEAKAGTELVRRSTRLVRPTEAGDAFYVRAKHIILELDTALEEAAGAEGPLHGSLRVAAPLTFGRLYLTDLFVEFAKAHPAVELILDCDDKLIDIRGGGYDLAIRIGELSDSTLIARRLAPAPLLLVASPSYLAVRGTPSRIEELAGHDCIAYGNAAIAQQWSFAARGQDTRPRNVTVRPRLNVNNGEIIRDAAIAGLGLAMLPLFMIGNALTEGRLVPILQGDVRSEAAIYAIWPVRSAPSRKLRMLIDLLAVRVPQLLAAAGALKVERSPAAGSGQ